MTNVFNLQRGSVGNKACPICAAMHVPQNKCDTNLLAKRVQQLLEANQAIPSLMKSNKEAVEIAQYLQGLCTQADYAQTLIQEVCVKHGDVGQLILAEYHNRLDEWAKKTISQGTSPEQTSTEQLTLSATEDKNSTPQQAGESSPLILSP